MNGQPDVPAEQEPIGIVISRGPHLEQAPTFLAYFWAPDPEESDDLLEASAA